MPSGLTQIYVVIWSGVQKENRATKDVRPYLVPGMGGF
jgi:hypothetical protein